MSIDTLIEYTSINGISIIEEEAQFDENDELVGFSVVETPDREIEREYHVFDDGVGYMVKVQDDGTEATMSGCYYTRSGDNPVLFSEAEQADAVRSAGGTSDLQPEWTPSFYSAAKPSGKVQFHNYNVITVWIFQNRDNKDKLQRGWSRFWKRYFSEKKAGTVSNWLMPWHVTRIKAAFNAAGITSKAK